MTFNERNRVSFLFAVLVVLLVVWAMTGCATERTYPPAPNGDTCPHDGTYQFTGCKSYFP
jgi:hypothetical protein